jgi:hypothetical protein
VSEPWDRFVGRVEGGRLRPSDKDRLQASIKALEGKSVELAIRQEPTKRTLPQNAHMHVLIRLLADAMGETELYTKRLAVLSALGVEAGSTKYTVLGREWNEARHTSDLGKDEASKVVDWLLAQCEFVGVRVPRPDQIAEVA